MGTRSPRKNPTDVRDMNQKVQGARGSTSFRLAKEGLYIPTEEREKNTQRFSNEKQTNNSV